MNNTFLRNLLARRRTAFKLFVFGIVTVWVGLSLYSADGSLLFFKNVNHSLSPQEAEADVMDFAVYRESSALEAIGNVTPVTLDWSIAESQSSIFSFDGASTTLTLGDAGHYLVMYNLGIETISGSNRSEIQGYIDHNGNDIAYGRSTCYIRRNEGTDECWMAGAAIIDATTTNTLLSIESIRTDNNSATVRRRANESGLMVVKLDDNWNYARIREDGGGQTFNSTTFSTVVWDNQEELDSIYSESAGAITLSESGHYLVTANVMFQNSSGSARRNNEIRLTLDGFELWGTRTTAYPRGSNSSQNHAASFVGIIEATTTNQILRLQGVCEGEACGGITNVGGETAISIAKLPASAEYVRLYENAGGQVVDATSDPILWDSQHEVDSASFSHSTTSQSSRINIDQAGDYLFFGSFFSDRTSTTDGNRQYPHWSWRQTGTLMEYGSFGKYNRGDQSTTGTYSAGNSAGLIFPNLGTSDYVELINTDEATGEDPLTTFVGSRYAVQGVRLASLIVDDVTVSSIGTQTATSSIPSTNFYLGGTFVFVENNATSAITSITFNEGGTVDAQNGLDNIELYYELDTSAPYNCASESYGGGETQFGVTDTDGFTAINGTVTFTDNVEIATSSAMCAYMVLDVTASSTDGETIDVEITDPSSDVVIPEGTVEPDTGVALSGSTSLEDDNLTQIHYHWRNDDGDETSTGATSATGGSEDTVLSSLSQTTRRRLRIEVSNEGSDTSTTTGFLLQYAQLISSCDTATGWTTVDSVGGDWFMDDSPNLTEGNDTTNITIASGGTTNENTTFLSPNSAVKDTSPLVASTTLTTSEYIEIEYAIVATTTAPDGTTYCFRVSDNGIPLTSYDVYPQATLSADVTVSATSTQISTSNAQTDDVYVGGGFVVVENAGSRNITDLTITETGTVDAQNNLNDIRIYYDLDTSAPYNCASESYAGDETQYGATSTSFSAANGSSTFTATVGISTTAAFCPYVVMDIGSAADGETLAIEISDPSTDVGISTGTVSPDTPVQISGTTTISGPVRTQTHYHWRNDNGSEAGATSATGGNEDTALTNMSKSTTYRLRMQVSNEGAASTTATQYRLEYGEIAGSCGAVASWINVGDVGGAWDITDSLNITDGGDTTDIAESLGGMTNENTEFLSPNAALEDSSSETAAITLSGSQFVEMEFALEPTESASNGTTYCFRLTDSGSDLESYTTYAQGTMRPDQDFFVQRGTVTFNNGSTTAEIVAGSDYTAPSASTSAFIRITNTQHTGAGHNVGGGIQGASIVTTYIANPSDILTGITFQRFGTTNTTRVSWEIVEYIGPPGGDNEIIVRDQRAVTFGSNDLFSTTTVTGISDDNDVVVWTTGAGNPDSGQGAYNMSQASAEWVGASNAFVLQRNEGSSNASIISAAVVEFTGANWVIQREEHNYSLAGTAESELIDTQINRDRAFIHVQKRTGEPGLDEHGHEVYLSSDTQVTFLLEGGVTTPGLHDSVAWIIENTQSSGIPMYVTRSNGTQAGGSEPSTVTVNIGTTTAALNISSIFTNNRVTGTGTNFPRPIMGVELISTTQYQLWISDTGQTRTYRTEVVQWPTAVRTLTQNYYRFYVDNDALDPTDPWPAGGTDLGENTSITGFDDPLEDTEQIRIRMSVLVGGGNLSASSTAFKLQYGQRDSSCSAITDWLDVGEIGSTTATWRGYAATPADGTSLTGNPPTGGALNLSVSDRAGTYEEENNTPGNPFKVSIGEDVEYDWVVQDNAAPDTVVYCFRMVESDGSVLSGYNFYPTLITGGFTVQSEDWRWYDDETNETPTTALAATNTAPVNVDYNDVVKLRMILAEIAGGSFTGIKYKLQYSLSSNFTEVFDVDDADECDDSSAWCYYDGAGVEHATVTSAVLLGAADSCSGGVGDGCGTHNEYAEVPQTFGEVGVLTATNTSFTVSLNNTYTDPIIIVETISGDSVNGYGSTNDPAAAMITATTSNSFDVRIQEPDNEADDHGSETVAYIVMEAGAHTLSDGTRIDAGRLSTASYNGNGVAGDSDDTCSFTQTFSAPPVVVGALQTNNNAGTPDFLTARHVSVSTTGTLCSMEVPDTEANAPSSNETIGWIAIEAGSTTVNGIDFSMATTSSLIDGWADLPWQRETFNRTFDSAPNIVALKNSVNGGDGGWVRYDDISATSTLFGVDERDDGERSHGSAEIVAYIAFDGTGNLIKPGSPTFHFAANAHSEHEFTVRNAGAIANRTYFFRAFDTTNSLETPASSTYPSLATQGATLTFTISGVENGSSTEGIITDVTTTATSVPFGSLSIGSEVEAAQRINTTTNAPNGYKVYLYEVQGLLGSSGEIPDVTGTNAIPLSWSAGCLVSAIGCYGYHSGDDTLEGGSTRFLVNDSYAALTSNLEEVAHNSGPVENEEHDIIFKTQVTGLQPAGQYESTIVYIIAPSF